MSKKEELYNSTNKLVGIEHSTITMKNNNISGKGAGIMSNQRDPLGASAQNTMRAERQNMPIDAVTNTLVRQAQQLENKKVIKDNDLEEAMKMEQTRINGHVGVIGVGQGGGNEAHLAKIAGFTTMAVNTSPEDTKNIDVDHIFIIKDSYGSGGEPARAKAKFVADADRFLEEFDANFHDHKTIIVVHTGNGGTGVGIAPMLSKVLKTNYPDKNILLFTLLGDIKEDIKSQRNAAGCLEDIKKAGVNYLMFDNGRVKDADSLDEVYDSVNNEAILAMRAISREHFIPNNRKNMDLIDMQNLYIDHKRMIIVSGNFDRKVSGTRDYEQQILDAVEDSTQIGTHGSSVSAYGIFLNVEDELYRDIDADFRKIQNTFGESFEFPRQLQTRESKEGPDFTIFITGLDDAVDRYALINKRIAEFNERRAANKSLGDVDKVILTGRETTQHIVPMDVAIKREKGAIDKSAFDEFM